MSTRPRSNEMSHLSSLKGAEVHDVDGEKIGTIDEVYVDRTGGQVRYIAIRTGWLGTRSHVVPVDDVSGVEDREDVRVPYRRSDLQGAPAYDPNDELAHDDEQAIYSHYGRQGYWEDVRAKQTTPSPTPEIAEADVISDRARGKDPLRGDYPKDRLSDDVDMAEGRRTAHDEPRGSRVRRWTS